jgi:uncharacterized protein (TIGR03067 family)
MAMIRLAKSLALLLALGALPVVATADEPPKGGKTDADRLQGTWKITEITVDGKEVEAASAETIRFVFDGKTLEYRSSTENEKGTYRLDPTVGPRAIDMINKEDKLISRGIYKFDGDDLIWCYVRSTAIDRPSEFASKPGTKVILLRLKKVVEKKDDKKKEK